MRLWMLVAVLTAPAMAQTLVKLQANASPAAGQPGITVVSVTGSGFPAGTILPAAVTLQLTQAGSGVAVPASPSAVTTVLGTTRRVTFLIPSSIFVLTPTAYRVSLSGATTTGTAFASDGAANLTVNPAASVTLTPRNGTPGSPLTVQITGTGTNFVNGATLVSLGAGIQVGGAAEGAPGPVVVASPTAATAQLLISPTATAGSRDLLLQTGTQTATLPGAFTVAPPGAPTLTTLSPNWALEGATLPNLQITGTSLTGATWSITPPTGLTLNSATTTSPTSATLSLTAVTAGTYDLVATTAGGASPTGTASRFTVLPAHLEAKSAVSVLNNTLSGTLRTTAFRFSALNATTLGLLNYSAFRFSVLNSGLSGVMRQTAFKFSVLNVLLAESLKVAFGPSVSVRNSVALGVGSPKSGRWALGGARAGRLKPGAAPPEAPTLLAGETVVFDVEAAPGDCVEMTAEGVVVERLCEAPYAFVYTVPASRPTLDLGWAAVHANGASEQTRTAYLVEPDGPVTVTGRVLNPAGLPQPGALVEVLAAGLQAEYFRFDQPLARLPDLTLREPLRRGFVSAVNLVNPRQVYGPDPLALGVERDWAARLHGQLRVERPGLHRLYFKAHAGARLRLDGAIVAEVSATGDEMGEATTELELAPGEHALEIVAFEGAGPAGWRLEWARPGAPRQVVPQEAFSTGPLWHSTTTEGGLFVIGSIPAALGPVELRASQAGRAGRAMPVTPAEITISLQ